jgi:hypothetical protein
MSADLHDELPDWVPTIECWQCAGEGLVSSCLEEFACVDPESGCEDCTKRCDICRGKGGWPDPSYMAVEEGAADAR